MTRKEMIISVKVRDWKVPNIPDTFFSKPNMGQICSRWHSNNGQTTKGLFPVLRIVNDDTIIWSWTQLTKLNLFQEAGRKTSLAGSSLPYAAQLSLVQFGLAFLAHGQIQYLKILFGWGKSNQTVRVWFLSQDSETPK